MVHIYLTCSCRKRALRKCLKVQAALEEHLGRWLDKTLCFCHIQSGPIRFLHFLSSQFETAQGFLLVRGTTSLTKLLPTLLQSSKENMLSGSERRAEHCSIIVSCTSKPRLDIQLLSAQKMLIGLVMFWPDSHWRCGFARFQTASL